MEIVTKKVPDQYIIECLTKELKEYAIDYCKSFPEGDVSKTAFDKIKHFNFKSNIDLGFGDNLVHMDDRSKNSNHLKNVYNYLSADQETNTLFYPKNTCMFWHTNSNNEGKRIYINFGIGGGIFRYIHPETKEVIDDIDYEGWTQREFYVSKTQPLWHCVYAPRARYSYGFNVKL